MKIVRWILVCCLLCVMVSCSLLQKQLKPKEEKYSPTVVEDLLAADSGKGKIDDNQDDLLVDEDSLYDYNRAENRPQQQDMQDQIDLRKVERDLKQTEESLDEENENISRKERKQLKKQQKELQKQLVEKRKEISAKYKAREKEAEQQRRIEEGDTLGFWEKHFPKTIERDISYERIYKELPKSILVFIPWNRSKEKSADKMFYACVTKTLALRGYYLPPSIAAYNTLAHDPEKTSQHYKDRDLSSFREEFGVDAVLFITVYTVNSEWWSTDTKMNAEYLLRSTKTNDTLFFRKINYVYDSPLPPRRLANNKDRRLDLEEKQQLLINVCVPMQETVFSDLPFGPYHREYLKDKKKFSYQEYMRYVVDTRPD